MASPRPQTPSRAQFDSASSAAALKAAFDAEVAAGPTQDRFYVAPRQAGAAGGAWSGGWSTPKGGVTADGKDLLQLLGASYSSLSASGGAGAANSGKGPKK